MHEHKVGEATNNSIVFIFAFLEGKEKTLVSSILFEICVAFIVMVRLT